MGACLEQVEAAVRGHTGDEVWGELGERVAAVRAALGCAPTVADVPGMQMVVVQKRP